MNLSERLDEARRKRARGEVADGGRSPFDLRMAVDDRTYDGTDVRDGSELTTDTWSERRSVEPEGGGLPPWNPSRANREVAVRWQAEASASPPAPPRSEDPAPCEASTVVPIRPAASADTGFGLPAWAGGAQVYRPLVSGPTPPQDEDRAGVSSCTNCGSVGRVEHLDLLEDVARLECETCGFRWIEAASAHSRRR